MTMKKDWMVIESELDDDQIKFLMSTMEKSCIVEGCAGSGKSVLALIKAQHIQKEYGNNYKIIVYTKALCEYMSSGKEALGLNNDFYYHWKWKNKQNCPPADYIIVDEIQDFTREEIQEFIDAARKGFYFFGDTAQSIYEGLKQTLRVDEIKFEFPQLRSRVKDFNLYRNYRLPIPVARLAHQVGIDLDTFEESTYKSRENVLPRIIHYNSHKEQIKAIHRIINNRNMTDVAILLPNNNLVREIYDQLQSFGGDYEVKYNDREHNSIEDLNFKSTNPKIMTYHSAKGLQFETVFLPYIECFDDRYRKALYVAITRTYRNLYIMHSQILPPILSNVEKSLYLTTETDDIEDI